MTLKEYIQQAQQLKQIAEAMDFDGWSRGYDEGYEDGKNDTNIKLARLIKEAYENGKNDMRVINDDQTTLESRLYHWHEVQKLLTEAYEKGKNDMRVIYDDQKTKQNKQKITKWQVIVSFTQEKYAKWYARKIQETGYLGEIKGVKT